MILAPTEATAPGDLETLENLFAQIGFRRIKVCDPRTHDRMIAHTSQLAHIVSNSYVKSPVSPDYVGFAGGSYKDMTRIACLNEKVWKELFLLNRDALLPEIDLLIRHMAELREAIAAEDGERLEELLGVAREYYRRKIPLSVIVLDFFHWPHQGDWTFDREYFPDPEAMIQELKEMGIRLMVSVWPTVDRKSVNYEEMKERDLLIRTNRGIQAAMECFGMEEFMDSTNPQAREFIWKTVKKNYFDKGVALFWLDEAEPEFTAADFDLYRYYDGSALECANEYPVGYAQAFYDGMRAAGVENPINLIRCAWAGSQKYGALVWSGDVPSTFTYLRNQFTAGLNMGMAGISWWTADIGGFHGGNVNDPAFHELLMRWFQYGTFCPVMRLHGDRDPHKAPMNPDAVYGGGICASGADNEVWSYTPELEEMMIYYIRLREAMKDYIRSVMREAHEKGTPVMKTLFYEFPEDPAAWEAEDVYLFGHDLLVAPVMEAGVRERTVYLPAGAEWVEWESKRRWSGGQEVRVKAPVCRIPLFLRNGAQVFQNADK